MHRKGKYLQQVKGEYLSAVGKAAGKNLQVVKGHQAHKSVAGKAQVCSR